MKITEYLNSDELQRGRYLLFDKATDEASVEALTDDEFREVHRAVNAFNVLGLYVHNRYINERDVLDAWAITVYRAWLVAQPYLAVRKRIQGYVPWSYFEELATKCEVALQAGNEMPEFRVWHRGSADEVGQTQIEPSAETDSAETEMPSLSSEIERP